MAIGAAAQQHARDPLRRPVAIGDGRRVDMRCPELRWGLDFLATQATVDAGVPVSWVISHQGCRPYHDYVAMRREWNAQHPLRRWLPGAPRPAQLVRRLGHYVFNLEHRAVPAPLVLGEREQALAAQWARKPFVVIEPHIKGNASPSKQWPFERYVQVARALRRHCEVYQVGAPDAPPLDDLPRLATRNFREVLPYLKAAQLYIGAEGGLHHASAAMGTRAVVIYGGYVPPSVTGYDFHINLNGGVRACGTHTHSCRHCVDAMARISVDEVLDAALQLLGNARERAAADAGAARRLSSVE
ncbi:glycosyltransferase family 9 protein [Solimonas terrae]|uniref:Glycosyltransferase family 9 protein n=2 Tax=Solimonas terrae TaxID=1396819 RepID=A0A6M2BVG9_9GAMM|nr:glycosyltransferase family 9 protein [Solimonas terrae]